MTKRKGLHRLSRFKTSLWNQSRGVVGRIYVINTERLSWVYLKCDTLSSDPSTVMLTKIFFLTYTIGWHDCISAVIWSIRALPFKMAFGWRGGAGVSECMHLLWGVTVTTIKFYCHRPLTDKLAHTFDPWPRRPPFKKRKKQKWQSFFSAVWPPQLLEQQPIWECKQQDKLTNCTQLDRDLGAGVSVV